MSSFQNQLNVPPITTQMTTPINNLPLKTTQESTSEIDDPLIQGVLKEFEDEFAFNNSENHPPQQQQQKPMAQQQVQQVQQVQQQYIQQQVQPQQNKIANLNYNNETTKKIINMDIARKSCILTIIISIIYYSNILKMLIGKLPASINSQISDKEYIVNFILLFVIIYVLYFFEII